MVTATARLRTSSSPRQVVVPPRCVTARWRRYRPASSVSGCAVSCSVTRPMVGPRSRPDTRKGAPREPERAPARRTCRVLRDAADVVAARPHLRLVHDRAGARRVPDVAVAGVDRDVVDAAGVVREDQVADPLVGLRDLADRVVLL